MIGGNRDKCPPVLPMTDRWDRWVTGQSWLQRIGCSSAKAPREERVDLTEFVHANFES